MMRRTIFVGLFVILSATSAKAQTPVAHPGDSIGWPQTGPDQATVSAYTYHMYEGGLNVVPSLAPTTCVQAPVPAPPTQFNCQALLPSILSNGSHTITLSASNAGGESPQTAPFTFLLQPFIPATPGVPKIIPKP